MALLCFLFSFRWCPISQLKTIPCTFSEYSSRVKMRNVWVSNQMTMKIHTGWWMSCKCTSQCHGISPSPIIVRLTLRQWSGASWDIHSGRRRSYLLRWVKSGKKPSGAWTVTDWWTGVFYLYENLFTFDRLPNHRVNGFGSHISSANSSKNK